MEKGRGGKYLDRNSDKISMTTKKNPQRKIAQCEGWGVGEVSVLDNKD